MSTGIWLCARFPFFMKSGRPANFRLAGPAPSFKRVREALVPLQTSKFLRLRVRELSNDQRETTTRMVTVGSRNSTKME